MHVEIDRERCVGSGLCALTAPAVFDQDEADGRVVLISARLVADLASTVAKAADLCPVGAIRVR